MEVEMNLLYMLVLFWNIIHMSGRVFNSERHILKGSHPKLGNQRMRVGERPVLHKE